MTLVPLVAVRPEPPNVAGDTALALSAVSCHVWAFAGSAAAPTARAPPSSPGTTIPSALLSLKCKASPRSVSLSLRALPDHLAGSATDRKKRCRQPRQPDGQCSPQRPTSSLLCRTLSGRLCMTPSGRQKLSGIGHLSVTVGLRRGMIGVWRARRNSGLDQVRPEGSPASPSQRPGDRHAGRRRRAGWLPPNGRERSRDARRTAAPGGLL
jgi:hypothetical protein